MLQLQILINTLRRSWWIIALTAAAAVLLTLVFNYASQPTYRTSARLLVTPDVSQLAGRDLVYSHYTLDRPSIVATLVEIAGSKSIFQDAAAALTVDSEATSAYRRSVVSLPNTSILEVAVEGPDPVMAQLLANTIGLRTVDYVRQHYDVYTMELLDPAGVPARPIRPTPARDASVALVLGLVLGSILAVVRDQVPHPLRTLQEWKALDHDSYAFTRPYLEKYLEEMTQSGAANVTLGLIQLNGLRELPEALPQSMKQRLLRQVTTTLREEVRGRDVVGRWDDISFAVLMPYVSRAESVESLQRIQQNLSQPRRVYEEGEAISLMPRVGAVISHNGETAPLLIERAEAALAQARSNGLHPVLYGPEVELVDG